MKQEPGRSGRHVDGHSSNALFTDCDYLTYLYPSHSHQRLGTFAEQSILPGQISDHQHAEREKYQSDFGPGYSMSWVHDWFDPEHARQPEVHGICLNHRLHRLAQILRRESLCFTKNTV